MASEGRYDVVFGARTEQFAQGARDVTQKLNSIGGTIIGMASRWLAPSFLVGFIGRMAKGSMEWGEQMENLSKRTGLSIERLQEWEFAAKTTGTTLDRFVLTLQYMTRAQQSALGGNEAAIRTFKDLGFSIAELATSTPEEVIMRVAEAFKAAGGGAQQMSDIIKIGGRGVGELLTAFNEGLVELKQRAHEVGAVVDTEIVQRLAAAHRRLEETEFRVRAKTAPAKLGIIAAIEAAWMLQRNYWTMFLKPSDEAAKIMTERMTRWMKDYGIGGAATSFPTNAVPMGAMALPYTPREATNLYNVLPQIQQAEASGDLKAAAQYLKSIDQNTREMSGKLDELQ